MSNDPLLSPIPAGRTAGGNCLFGAFWLMTILKTLNLRVLWRGRIIPHFYVVASDNSVWHFKFVEDILPNPFCYLWFRGRFTKGLS